MNILPPFSREGCAWPHICCAHCGDNLNVNDNFGDWDVRRHLATCQPYLASEAGHQWSQTDEGQKWLAAVAQETTR